MLSYLITDPSIYTQNSLDFRKNLEFSFNKFKPDFACFRDKSELPMDKKEQLVDIFLELCKRFGINSFINSYLELAFKKECNGVHLNSKQLFEISRSKVHNKEVIASTHNREEIEQSIKNGADYITYSPIFDSPKGFGLGVESLVEILNSYDIKIFALGGIVSSHEVNLLKDANPFGFASIRYFAK